MRARRSCCAAAAQEELFVAMGPTASRQAARAAPALVQHLQSAPARDLAPISPEQPPALLERPGPSLDDHASTATKVKGDSGRRIERPLRRLKGLVREPPDELARELLAVLSAEAVLRVGVLPPLDEFLVRVWLPG